MKSTLSVLTLASVLSVTVASSQQHGRDLSAIRAQRRALRGFERRRLQKRE